MRLRARRCGGLATCVALALALGAAPALAQNDADPAAAIAPPGAPEPLWVPDPEDADASATEADDAATDPLVAADVGVGEPVIESVPVDPAVLTEQRASLAQWMAAGMQDAGLPAELPVMAALVESGLRNLPYGDRDSVGYFQMRRGIWDRGAYAGYLARPDLQLRWFADHAIAVREARRAAGDATFGEDPATYGEWIAAVERPAAQYRGRYQPRLAEAQALLGTAAPPVSPFSVGPAVGTTAAADVTPDAAAQAVLADPAIELSDRASADLQAGRVESRLSQVLVAAAKIAPIAVSVFQTGHSYLTVHGTVSNHSFGRAVDIGAVGGEAVSRSNDAARQVALALSQLPDETRPTEIGTPWPIDDPAYFTDHMHQDHLHVGFDTVAGAGAPSSGSGPAGVVETVSLDTPRAPARAVAPTEPRFEAGAGDERDSAEPRFRVGETKG